MPRQNMTRQTIQPEMRDSWSSRNETTEDAPNLYLGGYESRPLGPHMHGKDVLAPRRAIVDFYGSWRPEAITSQ